MESKADQGSASAGATSDTSAPTATTTTPISALSTPTKKEQLKDQNSVDSFNWERRRSRRTKRASIHSIGSRKWSSASSRSDSLQQADSEHSLRHLSSGALSALASKVTVTAESDEEPVRWGLDQIELSDSDSDLEFFDAKGQYSLDLDISTHGTRRIKKTLISTAQIILYHPCMPGTWWETDFVLSLNKLCLTI